MSKIMIVDDDITSLSMARAILESEYTTIPVRSGYEALRLLAAGAEPPDLILLDINMPVVSGYEVLEKLKEDPKLCNIPVLFVSGEDTYSNEAEGFSSGVKDYISKPYIASTLLSRVRHHLSECEQQTRLIEQMDLLTEEKLSELMNLFDTLINAMAYLNSRRCPQLSWHSKRVSRYMRILATAVAASQGDLSAGDIDALSRCAGLHDMGLLALTDSDLEKYRNVELARTRGANIPQEPVAEESEFYTKHVDAGRDSLQVFMEAHPNNLYLTYTLEMVTHHHEWWNGKGAPDGLEGEAIPLSARMMAIVDNYDIITARRAYKFEYTHEDAVISIRRNAGTRFDPALVEIFLSVEDQMKACLGHIVQNT
ncbi:HD-GYP domain-containing protein [Anaerotruncus colihominis]|uniref:Stage 0 sporulation protein A homolog n=1 Tax=Anaerotruncus colihominis TaxID=169435 RepID=A0A845T7A0_9FIRM|nr:HD domain-containing phosphohydrolase [Anaerotruncus colihominis]MCR2024920.1 response regulator [Anaerotruncus colihominis]NBI77882.1 response regulator [Anaerotruncus colihominis]NDO40231.1 response regulator [Anaerotruncus colihominis]